jgi:hypothetical protein
MSNLEKLIAYCKELSSLEGVLNRSVARIGKENSYVFDNINSISFGNHGDFCFEHSDNANWANRRNWVLSYTDEVIYVKYDFYGMDDDCSSDYKLEQTLTIRNGNAKTKVKNKENMDEKTIEEMCDGIWKQMNVLTPLKLDVLHTKNNLLKKEELHKFFKDFQPEFKTLIDNVIAKQL